MTEKDLRHMKRKELLCVLLDLTRRNEQLEKEKCELEAKLSEKELLISECGSLAEASLRLNQIFEDADRAAFLYLEQVRLRADRLSETKTNN